MYSTKSCLKGSLKNIEINVPASFGKDFDILLDRLIRILPRILQKSLLRINNRRKNYKYQIKIRVSFKKYDFETRSYNRTQAWFVSEMSEVRGSVQQNRKKVRKALEKIASTFDVFVESGSGWIVTKIDEVLLSLNRYVRFSGGAGVSRSLPWDIKRSRACVTLTEVPPNECFLYAVAACLVKRKRNAHRSGQYKNVADILRKGLGDTLGRVNSRDIARFEKRTFVSVNVYAYEDGVVFPYYVTSKRDEKFHANLFLYKDHYYPIRNMSAFVGRQAKSRRSKIFVCHYCLTYYVSCDKYEKHVRMCCKKLQSFAVPEEKEIKFENVGCTLPSPFVVYFDLESICRTPTDVANLGLKTRKQGAHEPVSVCALLVCHVNSLLSSEKPFMYTGADCIDRFFDFLSETIEYVDRLHAHPVEIVMTEEDEDSFDSQDECSFCHVSFLSPLVKKCRDHCHFSGRYRSALCNTCNLQYASYKPKIYVVAHGLSNYDSHFIIHRMHRFQTSRISVIPRTSEKFLSFSIDRFYFKDSFQFLQESLASLVDALKDKGDSVFQNVNRYVTDPDKADVMKRKGVFPYSYLSDDAKLEERSLPPIDAFYNDLAQKHIENDQFAFAQRVWSLFDCVNLRDYMEVYLLSDTLLLADVFENFRASCLKWYGLDPIHYYSLPHMTFDAFLLYCSPKLEYFPHTDFYLFLRDGIRGGVSMISQRFSEANNPYMSSFDCTKPTKYIMYLDANNLYGWAMSQVLPWGNLRWMTREELTVDFITSLPDSGDKGCFVQVSLSYPSHLHNLHCDLPLAPEHRKVSQSMLSPYAKDVAKAIGTDTKHLSLKLMTTFLPKKNYIVHYRVLKFYLKMGLKVDEISDGVMFSQSAYIKPYVDLNTRRRAESKNSFDSKLYKLLTNALFGKTIERADKRTKVRLVSDSRKFEKLAGKPTFTSSKGIHKDLALVNMKYAQLTLSKPSYIGCAVLDLAKLKMYEFHYSFIKKMYGNRARLLMTDTDSLMYEIQSDVDIYRDLNRFSCLFDFSNYSKSHDNYSAKNKRVPGKFKDEAGGKIITKFVGLKSKMYAYSMEGHEFKTAKGVPQCVVENSLTFDSYRNCMLGAEKLEHTFKGIRSDRHSVFTRELNKVTLSSFDDKRYLLDNCFSLPYGHYSLI